LALEDSTDILFRNVGKKQNYQHTLRNNPEERIPHLHRGGEPEISQVLTSCDQLLRNQEKVFRLFGKLVAFFYEQIRKIVSQCVFYLRAML